MIREFGEKERRVVAGATDWPGSTDGDSRAYNAEGKIAGRSRSIQFLIRRVAQHLMDHAWEMEDRDLSA